nr:MAG TPA: hypothetical protein [Caudoviricetes sp.]
MNEHDRKLLECINLNLNSIVVNQALLFTKLDKLCAELAKENVLKKHLDPHAPHGARLLKK